MIFKHLNILFLFLIRGGKDLAERVKWRQRSKTQKRKGEGEDEEEERSSGVMRERSEVTHSYSPAWWTSEAGGGMDIQCKFQSCYLGMNTDFATDCLSFD